ncbi:MAG: YbhB/YbcL family Raf kinase inhibitor-like protein [Pedobacter sp.]|nr:MAG: YbhB/YbcL family Raf kinase inhibitor-like protein [Pedobacter sp.]
MKKLRLTLIALVGLATVSQAQNTFTLKSDDLGGQMSPKQEFNGFGCKGENISPQLSWVNPPKGTQSYAITVYDPLAPTGSGWWHWVVFDIPATANFVPANAGNPSSSLLPSGSIQGMTDFGKPGYGGPCPPEGHGFHQYIITIYALKKEKLGLDQQAGPATVGYVLNANTIEKASIVAYYKR